MKFFYNPFSGSEVSEKQLANADNDVQQEVMQYWFNENYESVNDDSATETKKPIWGGFFGAREEFENHFTGVVPDEDIAEFTESIY
ncbi:MAG: hypothetical protein V4525_05805 [Pseudomonadota bacterium]